MEKVQRAIASVRKGLMWARANRVAVLAIVGAVGAVVAQVWTDYPGQAVVSFVNAVLGA